MAVAAANKALEAHRALVRALSRPEAWPGPLPVGARFEIIETHISTLLLAGDGAIKLKKPVKMAFLDFSTRELRHHFVTEELRINRRTAPDLYRAVLPVTGPAGAPRIGGTGVILDWALWMCRFDNDMLYDRLAGSGRLTLAHVDQLAAVIARFHAGLFASPAGYGSADISRRWALDNFKTLLDPDLASALPESARNQLAALAASNDSRLRCIAPLLEKRRASGAVVECHGDLHLGNIVHFQDQPLLFDAVEFNPELRHMDRLSDVAFTFMDLCDHRLPRLAWRLLSQYLEHTGDYAGLPLLHWFAVDRALVRAKVALLSARQAAPAEGGPAIVAATRRIALADGLALPPPPRLIMTSGLSGSGKSTVALLLAESLGAVRIRSDVERKRLHGMTAIERPANTALLYNRRSTAATYQRLVQAAAAALDGGVSVVVDAAFLRRDERDAVRALGRDRKVECTVIECTAPQAVLAERIAHRADHGRDPSDADAGVLALQQLAREPLGTDERDAIVFRTDGVDGLLPGLVDDLVSQLGRTPLPRA